MVRYQLCQTSFRLHIKLCGCCVPVGLCKMLSLFLKVGSLCLCEQGTWCEFMCAACGACGCVCSMCSVSMWCVVACGGCLFKVVWGCLGLFGGGFNKQVLLWFSEFL